MSERSPDRVGQDEGSISAQSDEDTTPPSPRSPYQGDEVLDAVAAAGDEMVGRSVNSDIKVENGEGNDTKEGSFEAAVVEENEEEDDTTRDDRDAGDSDGSVVELGIEDGENDISRGVTCEDTIDDNRIPIIVEETESMLALEMEDGNGSVVHGGFQTQPNSGGSNKSSIDTFASNLSEESECYAPLRQLVNDRFAEASIKLHAVTGRKLLVLLASVVVAGILSMAFMGAGLRRALQIEESKDNGVPTSRDEDNEAVQNLVYMLMMLRIVLSVVVTVLVYMYIGMLVYVVSPDGKRSISFNSQLRKRKEAHIVVAGMLLSAWLLSPLNIVVTAVDFFHLSTAITVGDMETYFAAWPRERYSVVANSLYVAVHFYGIIYLFKWMRLEAIERERFLRRSFGPELYHPITGHEEANEYARVRSLRGLIPRMAVLYLMTRLVLGQALDFDMGFVPGLAWISVCRTCTSPLASCGTYPDIARAPLIVLFSCWELVLMIWGALEAQEAHRVLALYYLLQGRAHLVSFATIASIFAFLLPWWFLTSVVEVCSAPLGIVSSHTLQLSGVHVLDTPLAIPSTILVILLCYLFLPLDVNLFPKCLTFPQSPSQRCYYVKSYDDFVHASSPRSAKTRSKSKTGTVAETDVAATHTEPESASSLAKETSMNVVESLENSTQTVLSFDIVVLLWNFAHSMYLAGDSKNRQSDQDLMLLIEDDRFTIVEQVFLDQDDLHCVIFESNDMVVVAYRGNGANISSLLGTFKLSRKSMRHPDDFAAEDDGEEDNLHGMPNEMVDQETVHDEEASEDLRDPNRAQAPGLSKSQRFGSSYQKIPLGEEVKSALCGEAGPRVSANLFLRYVTTSKRVLSIVKSLLDEQERPVFLTGHGTGGSFATFCANDLATRNPAPILSVHTFGAPPSCNKAFATTYNKRVRNHFDVANVSDRLHGVRSFRHGQQLVRVGTPILLDSLGNLVIRPDWLEIKLMRASKRNRLNGHEPLAYTSGLMMWSQRMYGSDYRPLWTSSLHEVKLANKISPTQRAAGWQETVLRMYLETSEVGLDQYMDGACIKIRVLKVTGLHAQYSTCVLSCGPLGISSSFWEVGITKTAKLSEKTSLTEHDINRQQLQHALQKQQEQGVEDGDNFKKPPADVWVDAESLAGLTARRADFGSSDPILFGTLQKLRPCATITIAGVDTKNGSFGTVSLPITKLFPIPRDEPKAVSFEFQGRARNEEAGEIKVHIEVQSVGKINLESMCAQEFPLTSSTRSDAGGSTGKQIHRSNPKICLSHAMATFYLKRNFNRNSQRVVFKVGLMNAALQSVDLRRGWNIPPKQVFCELSLGSEFARSKGSASVFHPEWNELFTFGKLDTLTGFEELKVDFFSSWVTLDSAPLVGSIGAINNNSFEDVSPRAGFQSQASPSHQQQQQQQQQQLDRLATTVDSPTSKSSATGSASALLDNPNLVTEDARLIGTVKLSLSSLINKFRDNVLVKWEALVPEGSSNAPEQLPGHVCFCFEVGTEMLDIGNHLGPGRGPKTLLGNLDPEPSGRSMSSGGYTRGGRPKKFSMATASIRHFIRFSSPANRTTTSLSQPDPLGCQGRQRVDSYIDTPAAGVVPQEVPLEWRAKCASGYDERELLVRVFVSRAEGLDMPFLNGKSPTNGGNDMGPVDPYCEVALLDPLNDYEVQQSKRTVTIRNSSAPIWDEEFSFGRDRREPVRGNETLAIRVRKWELGAPPALIGEVRLPLSQFRNGKLNQKEFHVAPLELYDSKNKVMPESAASSANVTFAILVTEYIHKDSNHGHGDDFMNSENKKSPML